MAAVPKHKRIKNRKMIQAVRKSYCEYCGGQATGEPHHMFTVGSGGGDVEYNLIQLCSSCHMAVHAGHIQRNKLLTIVAEREGLDVEEVHRLNRRAMGYDV